jgi:hypothetical protein
MAGESRYGVKEPSVVYEVFEEEVVVLDLESGSYFSLRGSAAWIFQAAAGGVSSGAIAAACSRGDESGKVADSVGAFLDSLVGEGLLVPRPETALPPQPPPPPQLPESAEPFAPPHFEKFTDMKDLLLLDPIHDVDETGWPRAAAKTVHAPK